MFDRVSFLKTPLQRAVRFFGFLPLRIRPRQFDQLWIGDSHAPHFAGFPHYGRWRGGWFSQRACLWLGPVLMFHLAKSGIVLDDFDKRAMSRVKPRALVVCVGEIDVRIHLGADPTKVQMEWVESFVKEVIRFAELHLIPNVIIATPIRPASSSSRSEDFNANGSDQARVDATRHIEDLIEQVILEMGEPRVMCLVTSSLQIGNSETLNSMDTSDGVHASHSYALRVRAKVESMIKI